DPAHAPIGYDFSAYYEAAVFAKDNHPAEAYDDLQMIAAEHTRFPGAATKLPWNYPPLFTLLLFPLSFLPYLAAWLCWSALLVGGYAWLIRRSQGMWDVALLLFPGAVLNFFLGTNGILSTLLIGWGVQCLKKRPLLAGLFFALACFKPH